MLLRQRHAHSPAESAHTWHRQVYQTPKHQPQRPTTSPQWPKTRSKWPTNYKSRPRCPFHLLLYPLQPWYMASYQTTSPARSHTNSSMGPHLSQREKYCAQTRTHGKHPTNYSNDDQATGTARKTHPYHRRNWHPRSPTSLTVICHIPGVLHSTRNALNISATTCKTSSWTLSLLRTFKNPTST